MALGAPSVSRRRPQDLCEGNSTPRPVSCTQSCFLGPGIPWVLTGCRHCPQRDSVTMPWSLQGGSTSAPFPRDRR